MNTLKKKSIKSVIPLFLLFLIIGGVMMAVSLPAMLTSFEEPMDWEDVDFEGDIDGLYISGTVYCVYDCYCEETENGNPVGREYIIDADDYYYMGMSVDKKDFDEAEALMEAYWDYVDGYGDVDDVYAKQYEVTGTITKIPSDSLKFYREYIDWYNYTPEEEAMFLPYYLEVGKVGGYTPGGAIALVVIGAIFILLAFLFLILASTGSYQKSVKKYIAASASPDMAAEKVERFLQNTPETNNLRYNTEFICGQEGATTAFGETSKLVWVYLHTVTHKRYFITVSKTYTLMLGFKDGTRQSVTMKNEAAGKNHMLRLSEMFPHIITGYSAELERMFMKDMNSFLNLRYNQNQASTF